MSTWLEKYRPASLDDYIGRRADIRVMERFIEGWMERTRMEGFLILSGVAGIGKTTFAHAVANDQGLTIMEVNASDSRRKADLEAIVGAAQLKSYDDDGRMLLLDEVDGVQRWEPIKPLLERPTLPIIMTCNDISKLPYDIKQMGTTFALQHPPKHQRRMLVDRICDGEGLEHESHVRDAIAEQCNSWRSVINTLQTTPVGQEPTIIVDAIAVPGQDEVRRILQGERLVKHSASTGKIMRWAAWNMADPHTIQMCLHLQETKKFTPGVGAISDTLIHTLRVKGQIDAPQWRARVKKKTSKPDPVKKVETKAKSKPKDTGFGGFFS